MSEKNMLKCEVCSSHADIKAGSSHLYCARHYVGIEDEECLYWDVYSIFQGAIAGFSKESSERIFGEIKRQHPELIEKYKKEYMELDFNELKDSLVRIYNDYIENPRSNKVISSARLLHSRFSGSFPLLGSAFVSALSHLVDIGWKTGISPPSRETALKIIEELKK